MAEEEIGNGEWFYTDGRKQFIKHKAHDSTVSISIKMTQDQANIIVDYEHCKEK